MSDTHVRVNDAIHEKMKEISKKEDRHITEQYDIALRYFIKNYEKNQLIQDSGMEIYINERISKAENHLSSMIARTGMDTSMVLMGLIVLLEKLLKVDEKDIMYDLRNEGAKYFTTAIQHDKESKNK